VSAAPTRLILDASVAAKCFFEEPGREVALTMIAASRFICAPDLIFVEMASLASKKVRRGLTSEDIARDAMVALPELLTEAAPVAELSGMAFLLASQHGVSAYDGCYLALAMQRELMVLTADVRFARLAEQAGLGHLVLTLPAG
jgi:predicted nucleic acid-binding protein